MRAQPHFKKLALAFTAAALAGLMFIDGNSWATTPIKQADATQSERDARTAAARQIATPPAEHNDLTY